MTKPRVTLDRVLSRAGIASRTTTKDWITAGRVKVNGKVVMEGEISQAVSRNPVFTFRVRGGAKGDKIEVSWLDNQGDTNKTEGAVA